MASWTKATDPTSPVAPGVLRPEETARVAALRREYPVTPALVPFVERYWSVRWERTDHPSFRAEVVAHPCVNLSVETGTRPRFGFAMPAVLVHGVVTRRFSLDLRGSGRVTAAKFRPGGFAALTGLRVEPDRIVALPAALGLDPGAVAAAVLAEEGDDERAAALDATLAPLAREPDDAYLSLLDLLRTMLGDRSLTRVEEVAEIGGMSVRSLQRLFAAYIGVGPKAVLARYRLHAAVDAMDAGQVDGLADLAASLGWSDQAHFTRDFGAVVGATPSRYLRRPRP